jgi:hypothetical protein
MPEMKQVRNGEEESLWQEKYRYFRENLRFNKKRAYVSADLMVKVLRAMRTSQDSEEAVA